MHVIQEERGVATLMKMMELISNELPMLTRDRRQIALKETEMASQPGSNFGMFSIS